MNAAAVQKLQFTVIVWLLCVSQSVSTAYTIRVLVYLSVRLNVVVNIAQQKFTNGVLAC